jgi:hypothetical protein
MTTAAAGMPETRRLLDGRCAARSHCIWALYVLSALWGVAQITSRENALIYCLTSVMFGCAATLWAVTDSRIRGRPLLPIVRILFFFTWPLATLLYLVATRGWRGIGWWALNAFSLLATLCISLVLTSLALP